MISKINYKTYINVSNSKGHIKINNISEFTYNLL